MCKVICSAPPNWAAAFVSRGWDSIVEALSTLRHVSPHVVDALASWLTPRLDTLFVDASRDLHRILKLVLDIDIILGDSNLFMSVGKVRKFRRSVHDNLLAGLSPTILEQSADSLLLVRDVSDVLPEDLELVPRPGLMDDRGQERSVLWAENNGPLRPREWAFIL